jgi:hypothetical protein
MATAVVAQKTPRVFIVQEPLKRFPDGVRPRIDYNTLTPYGELQFIFAWRELKDNDLSNTAPLMRKLRQALRDFHDHDALVCLGNPALCAMALAVALECNDGYATVLDWIREEGRYREVEIDLHAQD